MYNATVYEYRDKKLYGTFAAQVETINDRAQMVRSNKAQITGFEYKLLAQPCPEVGADVGDAAYDAFLRMLYPESVFTICLDDCVGYKATIRNL